MLMITLPTLIALFFRFSFFVRLAFSSLVSTTWSTVGSFGGSAEDEATGITRFGWVEIGAEATDPAVGRGLVETLEPSFLTPPIVSCCETI